MTDGRDPRHDILFEPVQLGPVTAKNRFYQVPHCNGFGHRDITTAAAMRRMKAEGGWAVVCTEEVEIHPTSDLTPSIEGRLWTDDDIPALARIARAIHDGGALAGIELTHNGLDGPNLWSREIPLAPTGAPLIPRHPIQARTMTERDLADVRRWHRDAVERALRADYDLVYVYAGHGLALLQQFLSPRTNQRTDAYGGSLTNRLRLLREILDETLEACEGRAAVAVRLCVDELQPGGITLDDTRAVLGEIGEAPDLWDFMVGDWANDSITARFGPEASHSQAYAALAGLTTKPVVGVGRFTSPDTMAQHVRDGIIDLIGAARPSIADPFLPAKIEAGRSDEIRECIGCNICVASDNTSSGLRCTQNPTMGEEWRRGWHPERIELAPTRDRVLVVGAGPAGLEAAHVLGKAGHDVTLLEATRDLGGRARREATLPGLATWSRVADYRLDQIDRLANVEIHRESPVSADDVLEFGFSHAYVATGSVWRRDGVGRAHPWPIDGLSELAPDRLLTPDDLLDGRRPPGSNVVIFDDDHYYLGGVCAELLADEGHRVTLITPAGDASSWTSMTLELDRVYASLLSRGVDVLTRRTITGTAADRVEHACLHTGDTALVEADALVTVTSRAPQAELADDLQQRRGEWAAAGLLGVTAIGDALAPGTLAAAVYSGHKAARLHGHTDAEGDAALDIRREVTALADPTVGGGAV